MGTQYKELKKEVRDDMLVIAWGVVKKYVNSQQKELPCYIKKQDVISEIMLKIMENKYLERFDRKRNVLFSTYITNFAMRRYKVIDRNVRNRLRIVYNLGVEVHHMI